MKQQSEEKRRLLVSSSPDLPTGCAAADSADPAETPSLRRSSPPRACRTLESDDREISSKKEAVGGGGGGGVERPTPPGSLPERGVGSRRGPWLRRSPEVVGRESESERRGGRDDFVGEG
jgi:hypothetical protein